MTTIHYRLAPCRLKLMQNVVEGECLGSDPVKVILERLLPSPHIGDPEPHSVVAWG